MVAVKAFIGGLVGAILGTALYNYINPNPIPSVPWAAIIVGLLAGLGVLMLCGSARTKLTGLIGVVATLATLLIWPYIATQMSVKADAQRLEQLNSKQSQRAKTNSEVPRPETGEPKPDDSKTKEDKTDSPKTDPKKEDAESTGDKKQEAVADKKSADTGNNDQNKTADRAKQAMPKASGVTPDDKPLPRGKVTPALRNEGIAFGLAGLLAYLIGTGNGSRKQEARTNSRND